jgi:hypothetical protein
MKAQKKTKLDALAVAGFAAPRLRVLPDSVRNRRIAKTDSDGNVIGYTTLGEVQKSLLRRMGIEFDVQPEARPTKVFCAVCGAPIVVKTKKGKLPTWCDAACRAEHKRLAELRRVQTLNAVDAASAMGLDQEWINNLRRHGGLRDAS